MEIREAVSQDYNALAALTEQEGWNYSEQDFKDMDATNCAMTFVAVDGGRILGMIAFWGPIIALISSLFVWIVMRLLGFETLESIRQESVEQNNPAPAVIFVGTLIASVLFLMLVIKP